MKYPKINGVLSNGPVRIILSINNTIAWSGGGTGWSKRKATPEEAADGITTHVVEVRINEVQEDG